MTPFPGFRKATQAGPRRITPATPEGASLKADFLGFLPVPFGNPISGHGHPKPGGAKEAVQAAIRRACPETA